MLRTIPGWEKFDESKHCLKCTKPGTGTKDAPRAFSLKLRGTTRKFGLRALSYDPEMEMQATLRTAKHVDDVNMTGTEKQIDAYAKAVEHVFGPCKINKHEFTCVGVRHRKLANGDVTLDQDAYIATLRPIVSPELTGRPATEEASKQVADAFVSLRGALAYTALTQAWIFGLHCSSPTCAKADELGCSQAQCSHAEASTRPADTGLPCNETHWRCRYPQRQRLPPSHWGG